MPPANVVQSFFPAGSQVIPNPHGTAPGIDFVQPRENRCAARIFCLPGVPAEMKEMWNQTVSGAVRAMQPEPREIHHQMIRCFGVGESDLEAMLPDLIRRGRDPSVGITVSKATISLRISAAGPNAAACRDKIRPTFDTIHQCLGDLIFGYGDEELQHAVVKLLQERGLSLATLEFGTGGLVAYWLNEVSLAYEVYRGGEVLGYQPQVNGISTNMLQQLAKGVREKFAADVVLAVGPAPGDPLYIPPANTKDHVALLVLHTQGVIESTTPYSGHPDILKARTGKSGLNLVRKFLLQH